MSFGTDPCAAVAETHVSVTVFVGDRAYKLKKPVALGFLDFSSRPARLAACRREVELNRRLAPDVYLGVFDVTGPDGSACDHLVVMRRMPAERRLATLVEEGTDVRYELADVARVVAAFHAAAERSSVIDQAASVDSVRRNWEDNVAGLRPFVGSVLDDEPARRVEDRAHRYLDGRGPLFERRIGEGRVCDGHGDLLAEDIFCLADGPRILDCIEFDDRLRHGDVLADVAFLAMDLERLGRPALAGRFLADYVAVSGETHPASLAEHYIAYRAHVRAKVACVRHQQGDPDAAAAAARLLEISDRHLQNGRVRLVLVGGLPGVGKSTVAAGIGARLGWPVLRSDEVRKELAGLRPDQPAPAGYEAALYRPEATARTYAELLVRARRCIELGESVILDASWTRATHRDGAVRLADQTATDLVELRAEAPADVAATRLAARRDDASDATAEIAAAMAATADPWPAAIPVDTSGPPETAVAAALDAVRGAPADPADPPQ